MWRSLIKLPGFIRCIALCLMSTLAQADELNLSYGLGARHDDFRWAVAADLQGGSPNILSELSWRKLRAWEHQLGLEYHSESGWVGRVKLGRTDFNLGGEVQDSDYNFDNRRGEFSRSLNAAQGSTAQDAGLLMGRRFYLDESDNLTITPVIGRSRNVADLRMNDGVQIIPALGAYPNQNSRYRAQYDSTIAGVESRWWFLPPFGLDLQWHHHRFNYHAEADWNLRTDFQHPVSFYQQGSGTANRWTVGLLARMNRDWMMELAHSRHRSRLKNGLDVTNNADGTHQYTLLREVDWSSASTSLRLHRSF